MISFDKLFKKLQKSSKLHNSNAYFRPYNERMNYIITEFLTSELDHKLSDIPIIIFEYYDEKRDRNHRISVSRNHKSDPDIKTVKHPENIKCRFCFSIFDQDEFIGYIYWPKNEIEKRRRGKINLTQIKNRFIRTKNGAIRFLKRLISLKLLGIFFLIMYLLIFILSKWFIIFNPESYYINLTTLLVTVYFLDFLYSEQSRRETANKRYTIDHKLDGVFFELSSNMYDLLFYEKEFYDGYGNKVYPVGKIYELTEDDIYNIISKNNFWEQKIHSTNLNGYYNQYITKKQFLISMLKNTKTRLNEYFTRYATMMLDEDFMLLMNFDDAINDFYLTKYNDIDKLNYKMVALSLKNLINTNKRMFDIWGKWKN